MAWTPPKTWSVGQLVSAADLNEQVRDNLTILKVAVDDDGFIPSISSSYFQSLSGALIQGVAKTDVDNLFTGGDNNFNADAATRLSLPVGADKWAT